MSKTFHLDVSVRTTSDFKKLILPDIKAYLKKLNTSVLKKHGFNVMAQYNVKRYGMIQITWKFNRVPETITLRNTDIRTSGLKPEVSVSAIGNFKNFTVECGGMKYHFISELRERIYRLLDDFIINLGKELSGDRNSGTPCSRFFISHRVRFLAGPLNVSEYGSKLTQYDNY